MPAVLADLFLVETADVRLAGLDQLFRELVEPLEIVGSEVESIFPIEAEPAHVVLDRFDVLDLLGLGIGVVEAQVTEPAELAREPEVEADALGVADVQVAVRLGRKARVHADVFSAREIGCHDFPQEVVRRASAGSRINRHGRGTLRWRAGLIERGALLVAYRGAGDATRT